jgi:hypothetical protein
VYARLLPQEKTAGLAEYKNLRVLVAGLGAEQRAERRASVAAERQALIGRSLSVLSAALLSLFAFVVWFEPRSTRAAQSKRKILTGS